jgi:hypothetical protein
MVAHEEKRSFDFVAASLREPGPPLRMAKLKDGKTDELITS